MNTMSSEQIKESVASLDLSMTINSMVSRHGWSRKDAGDVCGLYRNYLFLAAKYPDKNLPPSEDVDEFWHTHILDTQKYRCDCDAIFGKYLDHNPDLSARGTASKSDATNAFAETQRLHYEEFGDYIYEVRGWFKKLASFVRKH